MAEYAPTVVGIPFKVGVGFHRGVEREVVFVEGVKGVCG